MATMTDKERASRAADILRRERKSRPDDPRLRACWVAYDGLRIGRTECMIQMMDDMRIASRA